MTPSYTLSQPRVSTVSVGRQTKRPKSLKLTAGQSQPDRTPKQSETACNFRNRNFTSKTGAGAGAHLGTAVAKVRACGLHTLLTAFGDEVIIILENVAETREVFAIAQRIRNEPAPSFRLGGRGVFEKTLRARAFNLLHTKRDLRRALERREFAVYYQPIVALGTGETRGFEALLRWRHPERGFIAPDEFIPVAEGTGLILPIGRWALEEACRQMREWQAQFPGAAGMYVSVNLSGHQSANPELCEQIKQALATTGLRPESLKLEITESVVTEEIEQTVEALRRLRALGVESSIDDFGTGYSSPLGLRRFPSTTLKIDRSFISHLGGADEDAESVRTTLLLARNLGLRVVAEGVETEAQFAHLRALSCDYAQGYLFSKAVNAAAVGRMLSEASPQSLRAANSKGLAGLRLLVA